MTIAAATDDAAVIARECIALHQAIGIGPLDLRGVGIHLSRLEPADGVPAEVVREGRAPPPPQLPSLLLAQTPREVVDRPTRTVDGDVSLVGGICICAPPVGGRFWLGAMMAHGAHDSGVGAGGASGAGSDRLPWTPTYSCSSRPTFRRMWRRRWG